MSVPPKKQAFESGESDSDDACSDGSEEGVQYTGGEEIQVNFEGRNPTDEDFHGIKTLLNQLFLKAHINLSELTDLIISQNNIGSVIKQSGDDDMDDDDDSDDGLMEVFGVTSVINLTSKKNYEAVDQLRTLLAELCAEHGNDSIKNAVKSLLDDENNHLGLIINERFVNIPPQIVVPLFETLSKEIRKACDRKMPYNFTHFIFICKLYKTDDSTNKKKSKKKGNRAESEVIWSNPEEELVDQMTDLKFEFSVKNDSDSGLVGNWLEDDESMTPFRRVLIVEASKLESIIQQFKLAL